MCIVHWCRPVHEQGLPVPAPGPGEPRARLPLVRPRLLSPRCAPPLLLFASIHSTAQNCTVLSVLYTEYGTYTVYFVHFDFRVHAIIVIIHSNLSHWRNLYSQHIPNQKSLITNYLNNRSINRLLDFRFNVQFGVILYEEHSKLVLIRTFEVFSHT